MADQSPSCSLYGIRSCLWEIDLGECFANEVFILKKDMVLIGKDVYIPEDIIVSVTGENNSQAKRHIKEAKEKLCLLDYTGGKKTKAVILTKDGWVMTSPLTPEEIISMDALEEV